MKRINIMKHYGIWPNVSVVLIVLSCCFILVFSNAYGQSANSVNDSTNELRRLAFLGVDLRGPSQEKAGAEVRQIVDAGIAAKIGLQTGDRILRVNQTLIDNYVTYQRIFPALRAGDSVRFEVIRNNHIVLFTTTLPPLPREHLKGVDTIYSSVLTDLGSKLSLIVTRPKNVSGKLPTVFLVGWLSCDSVESPFGPGDGFAQVLYDLAVNSGFALVRLDKPGVGDSSEPNCVDCNFHHELAGYQAAFRALKNYDFVDRDRIFILGLSNGAGFAPLVPQNESVRGYIVSGGWAKTWYEHMLELERRRLDLSGRTQSEINDLMKGYTEFYNDYLIRKMTPGEVLKAKPHLASLWYDQPGHQYGRPASFYHQLQDLNLASAWQKVNSPVLLLYGEYDWIMSKADHELIAKIVNSRQPGRATFVELPKTNHGLFAYDNMGDAFKGTPSGRYNSSVTDLVLKFLQSNRN